MLYSVPENAFERFVNALNCVSEIEDHKNGSRTKRYFCIGGEEVARIEISGDLVKTFCILGVDGVNGNEHK